MTLKNRGVHIVAVCLGRTWP